MLLRICGSSAHLKVRKFADFRFANRPPTYDQLGSLGGSLRYHVELKRPMVGDETNLNKKKKMGKTWVLWIK